LMTPAGSSVVRSIDLSSVNVVPEAVFKHNFETRGEPGILGVIVAYLHEIGFYARRDAIFTKNCIKHQLG
jgi:hypothetical protein